MRVLLQNAHIWQWTAAAHASPAAMLAAADRDEAHGFARWMLLDGNTIASVGNGEPPAGADQTIDLGGRTVLPGMHDSHIHCYMLGAVSMQVFLGDCSSIGAIREKVAAHGKANPSLEWIVGIGWDQTAWGGAFPSRHDLDGIEELGGRPCWLWRACWHIGVGNTEALSRAGIDRPTEVEGGSVELGPDGTPNGVLKENGAELIRPHLGERRADMRKRFLREAAWQCASVGLTAVHSHEFGEAWTASEVTVM